MKRILAASLVFLQVGTAAPKAVPTKGPMKQIEDVEGLPRVLLIGDSISIGSPSSQIVGG